ncbi:MULTISPECIES: MGMT family protein [unclassified Bacillus (in: firmicutes)]|uniref:MGMT family protein n=1 Tax=unclassified Bacillus (in: firmicutes) TaxID=185979 RepID=UPI0008E9C94F|nr:MULTISPECIES: MGMT family protein [unclassified Bacillus (in: firmicutes)]SFA71608.1 methylated-DNA-protein-cysteine methyltransferase related protein [Bacillus sp. UNCCL13]SFQ61808.1 methylated-DNA-protein-cysteine methyltransferase related protein [Bacillus sp. cl95]
MTPFTKRVIDIIANIPSGKVMTYGQVAACAGSPRGARQVVRILHSMSDKYGLPWHRVINARGQIGFHDEEAFMEQKHLLLNEGILFLDEARIDLKMYRFDSGD